MISRNFARFIESFFYPDSLRKSHWGFKEIRYGVGDRVMEMLADLYPDARFVFIVRDPIDVLASQVAMGWSAGWKELAEKWAVQNQSILNFCHTHGDRTRLVRFEDLILKESSTIDELFAWLGFEVSDKQRAILDIEEGIWRKTRDDGMPHRTMFSDRKLRRILRIVKAPKNALGY